MGIRETLNQNPRLTTGITIGMIVLVLGVIVWQLHGGSSAPILGNATPQLYFSDDDGKSWFPDDAKKIPPFDHNGKQAVSANVYKCDGKTFVNHLTRYTPDAKKKMEALAAKAVANDPTATESIQLTGLEVKRPGDADWVRSSEAARYNEVIKPHCKDVENLEQLRP